MKTRPQNIGIICLEIYFPRCYVSQTDLEKHEKVSPGKYTKGLGQSKLAFVDDREDVYSLSLTSVSNLMKKYRISYNSIGRLEVATETVQDHSKSVKSYLLQLFAESGNTNIEGIDSIHACYAGTNALFNSVDWIESSDQDGRYAMVVASDIAEYAKGPARPTSGCGSVCFLIGPNAPLIFERGCRVTHMENEFDFFKPHLDSPYPVVDGAHSNKCYLKAIDICYKRYVKRLQKARKLRTKISNIERDRMFESSSMNRNTREEIDKSNVFELQHDVDFAIFHSPYLKLVQKAYARLVWNDFLRFPDKPEYKEFRKFVSTMNTENGQSSSDIISAATNNDHLTNRELSLFLNKYCRNLHHRCVEPQSLLPKNLGNVYTASIFASLLSLVFNQGEKLAGKRVLMFSYGSGLAASMYSFIGGDSPAAIEQLRKIREVSDLENRLNQRQAIDPKIYHQIMSARENHYKSRGKYIPSNATSVQLGHGTQFLTHRDDFGRRFYKQVNEASVVGTSNTNSQAQTCSKL